MLLWKILAKLLEVEHINVEVVDQAATNSGQTFAFVLILRLKSRFN